MYAEVALLQGNFTYLLREEFSWVSPGLPALVPFKNSTTMGFIVGVKNKTTLERIRPIKALLSEEPVLSERQLNLSLEMAKYYGETQGICIKHMLPPWIRKQLKNSKPFYAAGNKRASVKVDAYSLQPDLKAAISSSIPETFLLLGSDRIMTYLSAIGHTLSIGKSVIFLLPEITGSTLAAEIIKKKFGANVVITHSKLKEKERGLIWEGIRRDNYSLCLGSISAVFAPFQNLGLVIVEEENSDLYKVEQRPWYNVRDVAVMRSKIEGIPCLLGSPTPSFESFHNTERGKYKLIDISYKESNVSTEVVDMRGERGLLISRCLEEKIWERLKRSEKVILFLPKKGYSRFCMCLDCGWIPYCPECSVTLDYYRREHKLRCHYCGHEESAPGVCVKCKGIRFTYSGEGTEMLEATLESIFRDAGIIRMDADILKTSTEHEETYRKFAEDGDILVGTQLVIKATQHESVTLIGIISCDSQLSFPDFRAAEKLFAQIIKAKDMIKKGELVLQTHNPANPIFKHIKYNDYPSFYLEEKKKRRVFGLPPFYHLVRILSQSKKKEKAKDMAERTAEDLRKQGYEILGASPCPIERIRGSWRFHILVKVKNPTGFFHNISLPKGVSAEVDPQEML